MLETNIHPRGPSINGINNLPTVCMLVVLLFMNKIDTFLVRGGLHLVGFTCDLSLSQWSRCLPPSKPKAFFGWQSS